MMKFELEIVKFNAADVITTSGVTCEGYVPCEGYCEMD